MNIPFFAKLFLIFIFYCISDLSIKKHILKNALHRAARAKRV